MSSLWLPCPFFEIYDFSILPSPVRHRVKAYDWISKWSNSHPSNPSAFSWELESLGDENLKILSKTPANFSPKNMSRYQFFAELSKLTNFSIQRIKIRTTTLQQIKFLQHWSFTMKCDISKYTMERIACGRAREPTRTYVMKSSLKNIRKTRSERASG